MTDLMRLTREAGRWKEGYPPGTRVELVRMDDPLDPVPAGTRGTVVFVDDLGQIHMNWDNGRTLAIVPQRDRFLKIAEAKEGEPA